MTAATVAGSSRTAKGSLRRDVGLVGLVALSGFAGLGYQIVWTQQAAVWLGHDSAAVLAVLGAFFGGLAVGAWTLAGPLGRSSRPARWYAAAEVIVAIWSLALSLLLDPVGAALMRLTGPSPTPLQHWTVGFVGIFVLLLPATAAMGATLPALERAVAGRWRGGATIAALYAANTAGAVVGVLAVAFWLVPAFGLARTAAWCATFNLLCAAGVWRGFGGVRAEHAEPLSPAPVPPLRVAGRPVLPLVAATGLLGIGWEVVVVRVLSQVAENTVYTFALLLAAYLLGTAAGAAAVRRSRRPADPALGDALLRALAAACLLSMLALWGAPALQAAVRQTLGGGAMAALAAEAAMAAAAFVPPSLVMGALFAHLAERARAAGIGFGRVLGINTFGAAFAPALFGVAAVPAVGAKAALLGIACGYLALASRAAWRRPAHAVLAGAGVTLALAAPPLIFVDVPEGGRVVAYREGALGAVSVVEDAGGVLRLRIDNRQQEGSSATHLADSRQALLPLLLHPAPRRALFLGLGTGVTARAAAGEARLQVDAVELLPEVIETSAIFARLEGTASPLPRLHAHAADARRFVRASDGHYDLIVSDNFHPARSGSAALYTVEHFAAVRARLAPDGLFCQWLPLHQLDLASLAHVVRSFTAVYPNAYALLATGSLQTPVIGLVARADGGRFALADVRARLASVELPKPPGAVGLVDEWAVLGGFVAGPRALARFAAGVAPNTDDHPIVAYRAPWITYAPDSTPVDRLMALLGAWSLDPAELLADAGSEPGASERLASYWRARDAFLAAGRDVEPVADPRRMLEQVKQPLLAALRLSADYRPAYEPLLQLALAVLPLDPDGGRALLGELAARVPARTEALAALRELDAARR